MRISRKYRSECVLPFAVLALTLISTPLVNAQVHVPNEVVNSAKGLELDQFLLRLNKFGFHGSVLVSQKGEIVLHKAYGISQLENDVSWTTGTPASIGSVVKQFTGAAILKLEMRGEVSTDDLISKYFSDVPADKAKITLHHLLTHSAGLPGALGDDFESVNREEYLKRALGTDLASEPGDLYEYSNVGYSLLAMIVEQVSGLGFEEFLLEEFFDPLGMSSTGWRIPKWDAKTVALSHENEAGRNSLLDLPIDRWHIEGNGGLYSTAADMYRWYLALQSDEILSEEAKKEYFARHIPEGPEARSFYGYGWVVMDTRRGGDVIWHNGGGAAGAFAMYQYVNDSAVFIVFTNKRMGGGYPMDDIAVYSSMIMFGDEYPTPPEVISVATDKLQSRVGEYLLGDGSTLRVVAVNGGLEVTPNGQSAMNALYPSEMAPMLDKYNDKSMKLFQALGANDFESASDLFAPHMPKPEIVTMLEEGWLETDTLGAFVSAVSHGVRMGEMVEAYLTLTFENGTEVFKSVWMMGECTGLRGGVSVPSQRLLPTSGSTFAAFSLQSGSISARFNEAGEMILDGPEGEIRAALSQ